MPNRTAHRLPLEPDATAADTAPLIDAVPADTTPVDAPSANDGSAPDRPEPDPLAEAFAISTWAGLPNYTCRVCPAAVLGTDAAWAHLAEHAPPPPPPIVAAPVILDRFGNPIDREA